MGGGKLRERKYSMLGRLRCPTAGDEDRLIFLIRSGRPKQMIVRAASLPVLPETSILFQAINRLFKALDRQRIRVTIVEVSNFPGHVNCRLRRHLLTPNAACPAERSGGH